MVPERNLEPRPRTASSPRPDSLSSRYPCLNRAGGVQSSALQVSLEGQCSTTDPFAEWENKGLGEMSRDVNKFGRITFCSIAVIVIAALSVVGTGIASASTNKPSAASDQYPPVVASQTTAGSSPKTTSSQGVASTGGTLPFTGVSLIWTAVGAVALVGLGIGLRRHDRKS